VAVGDPDGGRQSEPKVSCRLCGRTEANSSTNLTEVDHYADDGDSPACIDNGDGTWTRNITAIDGNLAATQSSNGTVQLQLTNLHGDVVATAAAAGGAEFG
jgi:hypothetical protein